MPATMVMAFFYLNGNLNDQDGFTYFKMGLLAAVPGIMIGVYIRMRTKKHSPPDSLLTISSCLCFVMSIMWIKFASDTIIALLELFGFVSQLPTSLFGLTILAWGNCLGDFTADVAMTKKGFGEMAITGTMAGPIF